MHSLSRSWLLFVYMFEVMKNKTFTSQESISGKATDDRALSFKRLAADALIGDYRGVHLEIFLLRGHLRLNFGPMNFDVSAKAFLDFLPFYEVSVCEASADAEAIVIVTSLKTFNRIFNASGGMPWQYTIKLRSEPCMSLTDAEMDTLCRRLSLLEELCDSPDDYSYNQRVSSAYYLLSNEIANVFLAKTGNDGNKSPSSPGRLIYEQFSTLVANNIKTQHKVEWYSKRIGITSQHLARVIRSFLGISPKGYIDHILMSEITMLKSHSNLSNKEIAYECGFEDPNSLTRFIKKNLREKPAADDRQKSY